MISCICGFKEVFLAVLGWCGRNDALLIAIVGFLSSVVIVKITSGLDTKKALFMRRLDAYEKAISHLSLKLNVYYNIQAAFESFKEPVLSVDLMKSKIVICLAVFQKLEEIEKDDSRVTSVALYTVFPSYDTGSIIKELAYFMSRLQYFSYCMNLPDVEDRIKQFELSFKSDVERIAPLIENETKYLDGIFMQLKNEIAKDKRIKKVLNKL
jgi:hypothetical protein